jgi:hypothetical protein
MKKVFAFLLITLSTQCVYGAAEAVLPEHLSGETLNRLPATLRFDAVQFYEVYKPLNGSADLAENPYRKFFEDLILNDYFGLREPDYGEYTRDFMEQGKLEFDIFDDLTGLSRRLDRTTLEDSTRGAWETRKNENYARFESDVKTLIDTQDPEDVFRLDRNVFIRFVGAALDKDVESRTKTLNLLAEHLLLPAARIKGPSYERKVGEFGNDIALQQERTEDIIVSLISNKPAPSSSWFTSSSAVAPETLTMRYDLDKLMVYLGRDKTFEGIYSLLERNLLFKREEERRWIARALNQGLFVGILGGVATAAISSVSFSHSDSPSRGVEEGTNESLSLDLASSNYSSSIASPTFELNFNMEYFGYSAGAAALTGSLRLLKTVTVDRLLTPPVLKLSEKAYRRELKLIAAYATAKVTSPHRKNITQDEIAELAYRLSELAAGDYFSRRCGCVPSVWSVYTTLPSKLLTDRERLGITGLDEIFNLDVDLV